MNKLHSLGIVTIQTDGESRTVTNTLVYSGVHIINKAITGQLSYVLSHVYIRFANTSSPSIPPPNQKNMLAQNLYASAPANHDTLRVPVLQPVVFATDGANYENNVVKFSIITSQTTGINGLSIVPGTSRVIALGLVAATGTSHTNDILYAYTTVDPPILVSGTGQINVFWSIKLTI